MDRAVNEYVKKHNMIAKGDKIAVGVSGGADSMCLLLFLMSVKEKYGLRLVVIHVNHGIRGESADRDEAYVRSFCETNGIEFRPVHADIPTLAKQSGCTEEEAGRNFRYETFFRICHEEGLNKIAVAHNRDDNAETVLFNLFRGSNISGMRGIAPVREREGVTVIRPLLATTRAEIEEYLEKKGVAFCTDETNATDEYSRNRLRNSVLPYIKENINSSAVAHITGFAEQAGEIEEFIAVLTDEAMTTLTSVGKLSVNGETVEVYADAVAGMRKLIAHSVIRRIIGGLAGSLKDIEEKHVASVYELAGKGTGKKLSLPYGIEVRTEYGRLVFKRSGKDPLPNSDLGGAQPLCICITGEGDYPIGSDRTVLSVRIKDRKDCPAGLKNDYTKWFDYDRIQGNLCIRNRREGDWLMIRSASGGRSARKLLKRLFMDEKVERAERERMFLLAEDSHILWAIGKRRDDSYLVTDETQKVLEVTIRYGG